MPVGLVVVGDDQIDAELARAPRRIGAADAAVDRDDQRHALGVQPIDRRRLQAVAVAQPLGDEVDDVAAEHLERAPQDHGRRDAVDVVVAVDGDALLARERLLEALDRAVHVGEPERIVELIERRVQEPRRVARDRRSPRRHSSRATVGMQFERRRRGAAACPSSHGRCCQRRDFMRCESPASRGRSALAYRRTPALPAPSGGTSRSARSSRSSTGSGGNSRERLATAPDRRAPWRVVVVVRAAGRLRDDRVDQSEREQVGRGDLERRRRLDLAVRRRATGSPRSPPAG